MKLCYFRMKNILKRDIYAGNGISFYAQPSSYGDFGSETQVEWPEAARIGLISSAICLIIQFAYRGNYGIVLKLALPKISYG